eukprot:g6395.t1
MGRWQKFRSAESSDGLKAVIIEGKSIQDNYGQSFTAFAAPGVFLFVLTLLCAPCIIISRCCCARKCCKPKKKLAEFSRCEKCFPLICFNFCALLSVLISFLCIYMIDVLAENSADALCELDRMLSKTESFAKDSTEPLQVFAGKIHSDGDPTTLKTKDYLCQDSIRHKVYSSLRDVQGLGIPATGKVKASNATDFNINVDARKGLPDAVSGLQTEQRYCLGVDDGVQPTLFYGSCVPVHIGATKYAHVEDGKNFCRWYENDVCPETESDDCSTVQNKPFCKVGCTYNILKEIKAEKDAFDAALKAVVTDKTCAKGASGATVDDASLWSSTKTELFDRLTDIEMNLSKEIDLLWSGIAGLHTQKQMIIAVNSTYEIANFTSSESNLRKSLGDIKTLTVEGTKNVAKYSWLIFVTCFLASFTGILGLLVSLTPCKGDDIIGAALLDISWVLQLLFTIAIFLMAGIGIPAAVGYCK